MAKISVRSSFCGAGNIPRRLFSLASLRLGASSRTRSPERIPNSQLAVDHLTILQVFRVKRRAVRFERSGGDLRVVDAEPVLLRDLQCCLVRIQRD